MTHSLTKYKRAAAMIAAMAATAAGIGACGADASSTAAATHRSDGRRAGGQAVTIRTATAPTVTQDSETRVPENAFGCAHPHGPFTIRGNEILDRAGHRFTPTGVTVYGLTMYGTSSSQPHAWNQDNQVRDDIAQIHVIADQWCANTVRIQAAPDALFSGPKRSGSINIRWVEALAREVHAAEHLGLNVVLTAQTEHEFADGRLIGQPMPTEQTVKYWKFIGRLFGNDPDIFLDIFNEPRDVTWGEWFHGERSQGYVGMNELVTDIRHDGIHNLLWVEGIQSGDTLAQVDQRRLRFADPQGIVYDIHHPAGAHDPAQWQIDFGRIARRHPVVIGEWTQYASGAPECWDDAATAVPEFLRYVHRHHLGLIAWSLNRPGVLLSGGLESAPTTIAAASYVCDTYTSDGQLTDQGAGEELMDWFYANNARGDRRQT